MKSERPLLKSKVAALTKEIEPGHKTTWAHLAREISGIVWAWKLWLSRGHFHLVASYSGDGKSALVLNAIGKAYLLDKPWPDRSPFGGEVGNIAWFEAEAAQAINLSRAKAWGLPLNRIIPPFADPMVDLKLSIPGHKDAVIKLMERPDIQIGIVDSLLGASGVKDENRSEFFETGKFFAEVARDTNKPIIGIHHIGKDFSCRGGINREITLEDVRGHSSIVQLARVVWGIDKPSGNEVKRLSVLKSNLGPFPKPIGFKIDSTGFLHYCAAPQSAERPPSKKETAEMLIRGYLRNGEKPAKKVESYLTKSHVSLDTAKELKGPLGIISERRGKEWFWVPPARWKNGEAK